MRIIKFNIFSFLIILGFVSHSQIVDDSTKQDISFDRTGYFLKEDIYRSDTNLRPLTYDDRFDVYQYNFNDSCLIQNLGVHGSAGRKYFESFNTELGNFDGVDVYEYLAFQDEDVKYYDTKTPFSYMAYRQNVGGPGQFEAEFSRSHEDIASVGFQLRRISSPFNQGLNPDDVLLLDNTALLVNGSFQAPNGKYKILANYRYMKQNVNENGGAIQVDTISSDDLILEDFVDTHLSGVQVQEKRNEWSVYQEYLPFGAGAFKLFHELDRIKKVNSYIDNSVGSHVDFYKNTYLSPEATQDSNVYRAITNKVGINGAYKAISYSGFLKNRWWKYESDTNLWDTSTVVKKRLSDNYLGGTLGFKTKKANGNGLLEIGLDGTSKVSLNTDLRFLKINFLNLVNRPTIRQNSWQENHFSWQNDFRNIEVQDLQIKPYFRNKKVDLYGMLRLQSLKNYIYYSDSLIPVQDKERQSIFVVGAHAGVELGNFYLSNYSQYANLGNAFYLPTPEFYSHLNVNYSLRSISWLRALRGKIGVDAFYFSSHNPLQFRADLQAFAVQNELQDDGYLKADAYLDLKYKTVQFTLKGVNLLQSLSGNDGYYPTFGYFGRKRGVEFGIKWMFFG